MRELFALAPVLFGARASKRHGVMEVILSSRMSLIPLAMCVAHHLVETDSKLAEIGVRFKEAVREIKLVEPVTVRP